MKRYALFYGDTYYPCGGWLDLRGSFDSAEEATAAVPEDGFLDWWHVVDLHAGEAVAGSHLSWLGGSKRIAVP